MHHNYSFIATKPSTMDFSVDSIKETLNKLKKIPRGYDCAVLTEHEFQQLRDGFDSLAPYNQSLYDYYDLCFNSRFIGMPLHTVKTREEVMPLVRELRRQGKYPLFVGIIKLKNQ